MNFETYVKLTKWCNNSVLKLDNVFICGGRVCEIGYTTKNAPIIIHLNKNKGIGRKDLNKEFEKVCQECGLKRKTTQKAIVFLHELGHYFTNDQLTQGQINYFNKRFKELTESNLSCLEQNKVYFRLNQEKMATTWACNFANEHPRLTKQLETILAN